MTKSEYKILLKKIEEEHAALEDKVLSLETFLNAARYNPDVSDESSKLMLAQHHYMSQYKEVLLKRHYLLKTELAQKEEECAKQELEESITAYEETVENVLKSIPTPGDTTLHSVGIRLKRTNHDDDDKEASSDAMLHELMDDLLDGLRM